MRIAKTESPLVRPNNSTVLEHTYVAHIEVLEMLTPARSGHIVRSVERLGDNPAGVVKLIARKARFLAMPAIARIWLISTKRLADILVPLLPQD